jgi:hypothetical protein
MKDEALNLALRVLEDLPGFRADIDNAITAIKEALAQPAQEPVNLIARTGDGRIVAPTLTTSYACKSCGFLNDLVQGNGKNFMRVPIGVTHESLCHACDDVEMVTWELDTHSLTAQPPQENT